MPAPERIFSGAHASNECGPGEHETHRCWSSYRSQGVESRATGSGYGVCECAQDGGKVREFARSACPAHTTDRPHLAAFILPSPVACLPLSRCHPRIRENAGQSATQFDCEHRRRASSFSVGPYRDRLADDGGCRNGTEISTVKRVRRLPVHDEDFVAGKEKASLPDR